MLVECFLLEAYVGSENCARCAFNQFGVLDRLCCSNSGSNVGYFESALLIEFKLSRSVIVKVGILV